MRLFRKSSLPFGFIGQLFINEMIVAQIDLLFKVLQDINANALGNKPGKTENGFITVTSKIAQRCARRQPRGRVEQASGIVTPVFLSLRFNENTSSPQTH